MTHDNRLSVGIVGGGILGRLIALKGDQLGWKVTLFDKGDESGSEACSFRPPAMLSPVCELDGSEPLIADLGNESMALWPQIVAATGEDVFLQHNGTLIVAHPHDRGEMARFKSSITSKVGADAYQMVTGQNLRSLEPQLDSCFVEGMYIAGEGQIDSRGALLAVANVLKQRGIICRYNSLAAKLESKSITANDETHSFDCMIDARGYGAKDDLPDLRAVRGEIVRLHAPDIHLNRPVRLLHPRYPLYVVPHGKGEYVIGATSIESDDASPMSVRSALELLSAAFALNAGFGEARITELTVGLRPAFPDNMPRIICEPGLLRVNGLYRHGYLIAPKMAELACAYIATGAKNDHYAALYYGA